MAVVGLQPVIADFSPADVPGLSLWLDASDVNGNSSTPADGTPIAVWRDKSLAGHDVVQGDSMYQPQYRHDTLLRADGQSMPTVRFASDWLSNGTIRATPGNLHVFVVSQRTDSHLGGNTYQRLVSTSDGADAYDWAAPDWTLTSPYDSTGVSQAYGPDIRSLGSAVGNLSIVNISVGRDAASGGSRLTGDMAEVLVYTNILTATELNLVQDYLNEKWINGVPVGPYFSQMTAVQGAETGAVDLSATLKGADADVYVCWDLSDQGTDLFLWNNTREYPSLAVDTVITAPLTNLNPNATYWYRFFATNQLTGAANWSESHPFTVGRGPVGAIRWDAWIGDLGWEASPGFFPGLEVERNLSPSYYHGRLPFYGEELSSSQILARATSQAVIDKEIAFAHAAGLDFWAYVLYDESTPLALARQLHESSIHRMDMNFCVIHEGARVGSGGIAAWPDKIQRYIDFFNEPNYQAVLNGRPLLFVLSPGNMVGINGFSSYAEAKNAFVQLRAAVVSEGIPSPYLVAMDFNASTAAANSALLGFDAVSNYAPSGSPDGAAPYSTLRGIAENWWASAAGTGAKVIPPVTSGWDRRPRIENPVSWESWQLPGVGISNYYERPTPQQLGAHVLSARDWCAANPSVAEADAMIIYAWNEMDEGGWIVPTLQEKATHLAAIQGVLGFDPDSDGDAMPDLWETWYFDSPANASAVTEHDFDGSLDFHEYVAGTNPVDPQSVFAFDTISHSGNTALTLSWQSVSNHIYAVQFRPGLAAGEWSTLTNNLSATAPQNVLTIDMQTTNGFYRITVE